MSYGASKDAALKIANVTGTLTDITAYLTSVDFSQSGNVIDTTTFGDAWKEYIRGQADLTFSVEGIYDPLMGTILFNLGTAGAGAWEYYPQGTASGKQRYGGSALMTAYSAPASLDEAVTFAAEFQVTAGGTVAAVA